MAHMLSGGEAFFVVQERFFSWLVAWECRNRSVYVDVIGSALLRGFWSAA